MEKIIHIGVLGCANIALRSVIPAILELPDHFKLRCLASRSYQKAAQHALPLGVKATEGYDSLIKEPGLQAVYIPLPNSMHAEWTEKALLAGLHVLVEKPLATNYSEAVALNQLATKKRLALVENFQFRFHSQMVYIKELVGKGVIGELRCLRSSFGFPGLSSENDIRFQKALGGGALLDTGVYPVKIAQLFLGLDIKVKAATLCTLPNREVDMWGGAYVQQKNGHLFGELSFGMSNHYQCNIELWGSKGKIYTNRIFTANPSVEPVIEIETKKGCERIILSPDQHFKNMLAHFHRVINGRADRTDEHKQNINQARLINEVQKVAEGA